MEEDIPKKAKRGGVMFVTKPYCEACKEELDFYPKTSMALCEGCRAILIEMIYDKRKKG